MAYLEEIKFKINALTHDETLSLEDMLEQLQGIKAEAEEFIREVMMDIKKQQKS